MAGDVIWIHQDIDGVMIAQVNPGRRLGMWMIRCNGVTGGMPAQEYCRDVPGDVAPMQVVHAYGCG